MTLYYEQHGQDRLALVHGWRKRWHMTDVAARFRRTFA